MIVLKRVMDRRREAGGNGFNEKGTEERKQLRKWRGEKHWKREMCRDSETERETQRKCVCVCVR